MNFFHHPFAPFFILLCGTLTLSCTESPQTSGSGNSSLPPLTADTPPPTLGGNDSANKVQTELPGWELTVYYTAVESYHSGSSTQVSGCLDLQCSSRGTIGSYPSDFLQAVKNEGTGRITSGNHSGSYLNWSYDTGYWLDTAPRNSYGNALTPFVSAAADSNVLARGTSFQISQCGSGATVSVCTLLQSAHWIVTDEFTPGLGGSNHLDLYIGEEDQPNFEATSSKYTTLSNATITI
jgi:hypothetical protein